MLGTSSAAHDSSSSSPSMASGSSPANPVGVPASRAVPLVEGTTVRDVPPLCSSWGSPSGGGGGGMGSASSSSGEKPRKIGAYAVQCVKCFKLRLIPTQEEYEAIRHNLIEYPWVCDRKHGVSCDDPADLEFDATSLWIVDKPNIPKTPVGCKRILSMRRDFTKMDAYYDMPNGKRVRSLGDVERFLESYPEYKSQFSVSNFGFSLPKVMEGTFPGISMETSSTSSRKRMNNARMQDLRDVNHGA